MSDVGFIWGNYRILWPVLCCSVQCQHGAGLLRHGQRENCPILAQGVQRCEGVVIAAFRLLLLVYVNALLFQIMINIHC